MPRSWRLLFLNCRIVNRAETSIDYLSYSDRIGANRPELENNGMVFEGGLGGDGFAPRSGKLPFIILPWHERKL